MQDDRSVVNFISIAVNKFRRQPDVDDETVYQHLITRGASRSMAARIVEFVPLAYGRVLMAGSGVTLSESYQRGEAEEGKELPTRELAKEPVWNAAMSFASSEKSRGKVEAKDWLCIAARSCEFEAVNQMLHAGSKISDLMLMPPVFPWPEEGPKISKPN